MATVVLQVVGAAIGGAIGGPAGAAVGRALGAAAGYAIDQSLFTKDQLIRGGRLEDSRILGSTDGAVIPRVYGRVRLGGQLIWATRFEEVRSVKKRGGKGGPSIKTESFNYYGNFAIGICEGTISHIGRIWADGKEIDQTKNVFRIYKGTQDQLPDPLIEAKQGFGKTPAFRGTAYVVFEDFALADFGNRIPQISFEVIRSIANVDRAVRAVTITPGATEFGYLPALRNSSFAGVLNEENTHTLIAQTDWQASLDELQAVCPNLEKVSLVVAWFGNDLRAGECLIEPRVSHHDFNRPNWSVSGATRNDAKLVSQFEGSPAYGGTPSDESVIKAIQDLKSRGLQVTLYPFIMMDIPPDNTLSDPYGSQKQSAYPWRGRITCEPAIGQLNSADATAIAKTQIQTFLGDAAPGEFISTVKTINFVGAPEWSYRRMILHYAHLCELAGGVDAFLVGSEMRSLSSVRDEQDSFPFVSGLIELADNCRSILRASTKISYAADWTEYFGYHPDTSSNDVYFNLDPLWANNSIDAIAIDNYMPMSNWRENRDHTRPSEKSIYSIDYLKSNILGGEGFDWFYANETDLENQETTPITDGYGENWIWAYKNIPAWWASPHHERKNGLRSVLPTDWVPGSKPVWFSEFGCPAIDRGANQPNVFLDAKSAESALPRFSKGSRDDLMQLRAIEAQLDFWSDGKVADMASDFPGNINLSQMLNASDITLWTWDARPYPAFPQQSDIWKDASNWYRGHWLNGRLGTCPIDDLIKAIFADFGLEPPQCSIDGHCQGFVISGETSARAALEPILLLNNISVNESNGDLVLQSKAYQDELMIETGDLVQESEEAELSLTKQSEIELPREILLSHADIELNYDTVTSTSRRLETASDRQVKTELPIVICRDEAVQLAQARLRDFWIARDSAKFRLPWKFLRLCQGDVVTLDGSKQFQVKNLVDGIDREIEATAFQLFDEKLPWSEPVLNRSSQTIGEGAPDVIFLNLPLDQESLQPQPRIYVAANAIPWRRNYSVEMSPIQTGFEQVATINDPALIFSTNQTLLSGPIGRWDYANCLDVTVISVLSEFQSVDAELIFAGANAIAIHTGGQNWEIMQFRHAEISGPKSWRLSGLLRGQLGSDAEMVLTIPVGAKGVLLNSAIIPVSLSSSQVGLTLNWKVSPFGVNAGSASIVETTAVCTGINSRPMRPCHLRAGFDAGAYWFEWMRRSRINSDNWDTVEVALDFSVEAYSIEILDINGITRRSVNVSSPNYIYDDSARLLDFGSLSAPFEICVAQLSNTLNPGPYARLSLVP